MLFSPPVWPVFLSPPFFLSLSLCFTCCLAILQRIGRARSADRLMSMFAVVVVTSSRGSTRAIAVVVVDVFKYAP
uniref:Putative secreted protein n=1 Tax=Anopheles darlingi TaxID=43151 RepID=A0A2M4D2Z4_ANODA